MKRPIRRFIILCLVIIEIFTIERFCRRQTDGFTFSAIQSDLAFDPSWDISYSPQEEKEALEALNQSFRYLARGAQAFAFESEDGKYVIKFFRHHRMRKKPWHSFLPLPRDLLARSQTSIVKRQEKLKQDFQSYKIAYQELKDQTKLIYLHLNKTNHLGKKLTFYDKIGVRHCVDLDKLEFLVQRKGSLLYPKMQEWIDNDDLDPAKKIIEELVVLLRDRCKKGIFDKDPDLLTNFGWIDGHPFQLDVGRFRYDHSRKDPSIYQDELIRITDRFSNWLSERSPELAAHLHAQVH